MKTETKMSRFAKFAWFVLAYNIVVILWGVFLRASYSGDGCGQHWLTCHGEVIPSAPELKTVIEFSHRVTTSLAGILVIVLLIWAFRRFKKGESVRKAALLSFLFIIIEGLVGAGLVLTGNTAANWTPSRPYWTAGHLINTFILLAFLSLTAWFAGGGKRLSFKVPAKVWVGITLGVATIFIVGISGSMAALTSMLFPSTSLAEGIAKDFSPDSHLLLRLRIIHPISAIFTAIYLLFLAGWLRKLRPESESVLKWSNILSILVLCQIAFGAATLLMLAPIIMQLGHLFLADAVWIAFIILSASMLEKSDEIAA